MDALENAAGGAPDFAEKGEWFVKGSPSAWVHAHPSVVVRHVAGFVVGLSVVLLGVAGTATAAPRATAKPVLNIGLAYAGQINPATNPNGTYILQNAIAYAPLIHLNPNGSLSPGLATSWHFASDKAGPNKVFVLNLRRGAKFSNGEPVTAAAVVTWLKYYLSQPSHTGTIGPKPVVKATGTYSVQIRMRIPDSQLPSRLSETVGNMGFVAAPKGIASPAALNSETMGAGPYVLSPSDTVSGDHYTYLPNKFYYAKSQIRFSKVVIRVIGTPTSMLAALQSGQIDLAYGDPSTADAAGRAGFKVASVRLKWSGLAFDNLGEKSPVADVRVRQALNYAIDRKAIASALYGKFAAPSSVLPFVGITPRSKLANYYSYNPAKAKSLLAAAGYAQGFTLAVNVGQVGGSTATQAMQKYLGDVGVTLKLVYDPTFDLNAVNAWEVSLYGAQDPTTFYSQYLAPNSLLNPFRWYDVTLNKLWLRTLRAPNPVSVWQQMATRITTQAYFLPVARQDALWYYSKRLKGVRVTNRPPLIPLVSEIAPA